MAAIVVIEPIFDEDLHSRSNTPTEPTTTPTEAVREVQGWLDRGYTEVVDDVT